MSVLTQVGVRVRILVIDDASSDDTAIVGRALEDKHPEVEFRSHAVNQRHIATYNEGLIDWSRNEYCVLLSADDMLAPGSLERAVRIMEADRSIGMVYGNAIHFKEESELPTKISRRSGVMRFDGQEWLRMRCRAGYNVITSPEVVVRGDIQRRVGGYRPELPHSGDLEMWLRIAAVSNIAYVRGTPQAFYRVHARSMQRTQFHGSLVDLVERRAAFESFVNRYCGEREDRDRLQEISGRALAKEALWDACRLYDHDNAESNEIDALLSFAQTAFPGASSLSEFNALQRRKRLGSVFCNRTQLFFVPSMIRSASRRFLKWRLKRIGV